MVVYAALGLAALAEVYAIKYNMEHPIGSSSGFSLNDSGIGSDVNLSKKEQSPSNVGNSLKQKAQAPVTAAGSPAPNDGNGGKHGKDDHDDAINQKVKEVKQSGGKNIRKNQQQVDASGKRVGKNRPDVQWDDKDGKHHCWEVDHNPKSSANHGAVISSNDPNAIVELVIIK